MMIEVTNVKKDFEDLEALKDINISIKRGSIYGLLGSNGAGKTTLLKLIAGIYKQDSGRVSIDTQPVYENIDIKQRMIFLADAPFYFSNYTVKQMAEFFEDMYPRWNKQRFEHLVKQFELDPAKKVQRFSKGMQRQVAFILAFSAMPDILILDEPIDGLDPVMRKRVKTLIVDDVAERGMTVIISSHNLREIEDICDHVGILHKGKLILEKDLEDLKSDVHKVQVAFQGHPSKELFQNINILYKEERGSVLLLIVKGREDQVKEHFQSFQPVIFDLLPLTLEEIFIYEMGGIGYAFENILV
jgi:ABC-2 type transport system ATP-binding protein